ncbi:FGGY family carbohydrate kinase, partial [Mammaliicoccus fleurettii]|nr:FGGY family carbohydrate kinase [Mammaliicoccus fleurettii]
MKYMIGIDIGTTSTKAVIYDEEGNFLNKHSIEYPMSTKEIGVAEENPEEIFDAVIFTVK